jgi:hypothetical protein
MALVSGGLYLFLLLGAVVSGIGLFGYGVGQLVPGAAEVRADRGLRAGAAWAGAGALGLLAIGMLGVGWSVLKAEDGGAGSAPIVPCRTGDAALDSGIVDYSVSYVPFGFECLRSDGSRYLTGAVPDFVNPGIAVLGFSAVGVAFTVAYRTELRARRVTRAGAGDAGSG